MTAIFALQLGWIHYNNMIMNAVFGKNRKKGFTLVELIVTFALLSIFLAACSVSLSSFLKVYGRVKDVESARQLSDTLMETVSGSLGGATFSTSETNKSVAITDGNSAAEYTDNKGYRIKLMLGAGENEGRIVLQYQMMDDAQGGQFSAVNWAYKDGVYRDNTVSGLSFEHIANSNRIEVTFTVTNNVTGFSYTTSHVVECYNLSADDISEG